MKLDIIFENEEFVAINKPSGLLSIPDRTQSEPSLKDHLIQKYGTIYTVHRLDKNTSGLIIFAKNEVAHKALSALFMGHSMKKLYVGFVNGVIYPEQGSINAPIMEHLIIKGKMTVNQKGKEALTDYETLEKFKNYSLVQYHIHTGRTHQIRVHTQYVGYSIVCDELYGDNKPIYLSALKRNFNLSKKEDEERPILGRMALHSWKLDFVLNEQNYQLEAPFPKEFTAVRNQLRKYNS